MKFMLSTDDIKKITNAQIEAQKQIFFTKDQLEEKFYTKPEMDTKFSGLQSSIDSFTKDKQTKDQELPVLNRRVKEVENWVDKAAPKLGIKFQR